MKLRIEHLSIAATWLVSSSLVALAVAAAWLAAGWIWQLSSVPPTPTFGEQPTADEAARRIAGQRWFGHAPAAGETTPSLPFDAFRLRGVVAPAAAKQGGQRGNEGIGIFSRPGTALRTVAVGEEIASGWRLLAVSRAEAVVGNGAVRHRLALRGDREDRGARTPASPAIAQRADEAHSTAPASRAADDL